MQSYVDDAYRTFTEEVSGALLGKEGYCVELGATGGVQLATTGLAIGVITARLTGDNAVTVRLFGKGGTLKVVQGGAIAGGARVKVASGGKVVFTNTPGDRSLGIKLQPFASGADLDVIELLDVVEKI